MAELYHHLHTHPQADAKAELQAWAGELSALHGTLARKASANNCCSRKGCPMILFRVYRLREGLLEDGVRKPGYEAQPALI